MDSCPCSCCHALRPSTPTDRKLREEMAALTGWSDGAYRGKVVPGVAPKWHVRLRQLLTQLHEVVDRMPVALDSSCEQAA